MDSRVTKVEDLDVYNFNLKAKGGGGTDFRPGFEYISKENIQPACIIYFTDGSCSLFPQEPDVPTLWVLTSQFDFKPPFGEVIFMEQRE